MLILSLWEDELITILIYILLKAFKVSLKDVLNIRKFFQSLKENLESMLTVREDPHLCSLHLH